MPTEQNKAIVERYYGELNRGNLSIVDELIDEDFVAHDPNLPRTCARG
ncbi:MAG: nuclear transport factor 2 family protein [Thermomicrobiales bacterium]